MREIRHLLDIDAMTVTGRTLGEALEDGRQHWVDPAVVRPVTSPAYPSGGLIWLRGSLAPRGALIKRSAASPELLTEQAVPWSLPRRRIVARIDDPALTSRPATFSSSRMRAR